MTADPGDLAWVPDDGTFGARLALVRQKMKWNLKEAALACALKPNTWRDWELGEREPHRLEAVCRQIARHTGCNHIWLMTGVDFPTPPVPPAGFEPAAFRSEDPWENPQDAYESAGDQIAEVTPLRRVS